MPRITDMTTGSTTKHILRFAFPLIITNIGQQLYMIADAAIVGRGVGVKALASVGAADWSYWLVLWTVIGLAQGFSTFVSRFFGDRNYRDMNKTIAMSVLLSFVIGCVLTIAGLLVSRPLLVLLNTPADIIDGADMYLKTMISGTLVVTAYNLAGSILRALGDGRSPLIAMIISALLNIGLDMLFVFVFHWGIFGAALASVLSQLVSFLYCLAVLRRIDCISIIGKTFKPDYKMIKSMLLFGIPLALQSIVIALGGIVLQSSINLQGSTFIAGYTATNKVYGLLESSAISLGLACSTFFAQNYGAKNYDRVKKGVVTASKIVVIMAIVVMALTLIARPYMLRLFLDISEPGGPEALAIGVRYLTIMVFFLIILYLIHVFRNVLQAMEISFWSMISGFAELAARVFMAKVGLYLMGSDALFISEPMAWIGALLTTMIPYFYYKNKLLK